MNKITKKAFTMLELMLVILIIIIISVALIWMLKWINKNYHDQELIQRKIYNLEFSIWNFPKDIKDDYISQQYKLKPVDSILITLSSKWINDYLYLTKEDYKKYFLNTDYSFKWFNNVLTNKNNTFYYGKIIDGITDRTNKTNFEQNPLTKCIIEQKTNLQKFYTIKFENPSKNFNFLIVDNNVYYINDWSNPIWKNYNFPIVKKIKCYYNAIGSDSEKNFILSF